LVCPVSFSPTKVHVEGNIYCYLHPGTYILLEVTTLRSDAVRKLERQGNIVHIFNDYHTVSA